VVWTVYKFNILSLPLGWDAASLGKLCPMFRDDFVVPSSKVESVKNFHPKWSKFRSRITLGHFDPSIRYDHVVSKHRWLITQWAASHPRKKNTSDTILRTPKNSQLYFVSFQSKHPITYLHEQEGGFVSPPRLLRKQQNLRGLSRISHCLHCVHRHNFTFTCHEQAPAYAVQYLPTAYRSCTR
jgi:hypothetical protein